MNKFKISHLKAMKKADIYSLCLKEFGDDTAGTYRHYTKAEMIADLMTVTAGETVSGAVPKTCELDTAQSKSAPTTPSETPATNGEPLEITFTGFYQSFHAKQPYQVVETDIDNAHENGVDLDDETIEKIWDIFHGRDNPLGTGFTWQKYFEQVADKYVRFVLTAVLDPSQPLAEVLQRVEVDSPNEYNFTADKIYAVMTQRPHRLTLDYFQANNLIDPLIWFIKARHTSYDGCISFVNLSPSLEEVFATHADNPYIDCAMYVLTCHAFNLDPYEGYAYNAWVIDSQFIVYMLAGMYYEEFTYQYAPPACFGMMQGE